MTLILLIIITLLMGYAVNLLTELNQQDKLVLNGVNALVREIKENNNGENRNSN